MTSTLESSNSILDIKSLDIGFRLEAGNHQSMRDQFIKFCHGPINYFWKGPQIHTVLKDFNLELKKGDRVGLIGVNGTGKTSLCRYIAGMYGRNNKINVQGNVRAIFNTETGIIPELSGRENANILATLMYPGLKKQERKELIEESLEFSELGEFSKQPFNIYSKGMKTRLFLSLVSSRPCDLLILDEVFDGADMFFNEKISKRIKKLIKDSGAVIFVSHSPDQIKDICNRTVIIHNKIKAFDGDVIKGLDYYINQCGGQ